MSGHSMARCLATRLFDTDQFMPAAVVGLVAAGLLSGCTHSMQVKNLSAYSKTASAPKSINVLIQSRASESDEKELVRFVHEALATHSSVARAAVAPVPEDFHPDVVVTVDPHTTYDGSWLNYPITFPGFLLFTHAWNGYVYEADVTTDVEVSSPGGASLAKATLETDYDLRHCDFGRGAATSSGWYTPGYGGLNLVIGFWMVQYDDDATPEFLREVRSAYGQYVANSIVEMSAKPAANTAESAHGLDSAPPLREAAAR